ncbi:MAG: TetR/AcrR family transcriptional regulator [Candidatus Hydrogenedentes bacterium]|nr:TetR/AcrR family transcriptional regulator [Candidatus Hydrogenedentota bacterium]
MGEARPKIRTAWLAAGLDLLDQSGPGGLTLEALTARVGLTKGSFYHHFGDRDGFVAALLQHWEQEMTFKLIEQADRSRTTREKQRELTHQTMAFHGSHVELQLRAWAMNSPLVRASVERVDRARYEYLTRIATGITGDKARGRNLARITYAVFVGAQQTLPPMSRETLLKLYEELDRLYV